MNGIQAPGKLFGSFGHIGLVLQLHCCSCDGFATKYDKPWNVSDIEKTFAHCSPPMSALIFPLISFLILTEFFCIINFFQMFMGKGLSSFLSTYQLLSSADIN